MKRSSIGTMSTNSQNSNQAVFAAIDVGSSKIVALVARQTLDGKFECQGLSSTSAAGVKDGVVVDVSAATEAIQKVIQGAQQDSGLTITEAIVTISGSHVRSHDSSGFVVVSGKGITQDDIDRAIEAANSYSLSGDDLILQTIVQGYSINGELKLVPPIGYAARRLEAQVLRITAKTMWINNLVESVQRSGIKVSGLLPQALAASHAVLSEADKQEGICLIDIGGATTDIAVFTGGTLVLLKTIPYGGEAITSDIANHLHVPFHKAEHHKVEHGAVMADASADAEYRAGGQLAQMSINAGHSELTRLELAKLIHPKVQELMFQILGVLIQNDLRGALRKGIVLTGGTANLAGLTNLFSSSMHCHVSTRLPCTPSFCDERLQYPEYASVVGALAVSSQVQRV
jgi:cell division protein FtsA